jgi:hypothetical protein
MIAYSCEAEKSDEFTQTTGLRLHNPGGGSRRQRKSAPIDGQIEIRVASDRQLSETINGESALFLTRPAAAEH